MSNVKHYFLPFRNQLCDRKYRGRASLSSHLSRDHMVKKDRIESAGFVNGSSNRIREDGSLESLQMLSNDFILF